MILDTAQGLSKYLAGQAAKYVMLRFGSLHIL